MRISFSALIMLVTIAAVIISGCTSTKYVCPDGTQTSNPSECPQQVECKWNVDCGSPQLRCLSNHCVGIETFNKAHGIGEGDNARVVECNSNSQCGEDYTCSDNLCVRPLATVTN